MQIAMLKSIPISGVFWYEVNELIERLATD